MRTPLQTLSRRSALACVVIAHVLACAPPSTTSARQQGAQRPPTKRRYCSLPPAGVGVGYGPGVGTGLPLGDPASTSGAPAAEANETETEEIVFTAREVDRKAVLLRRPEPVYTPEARDLKVKGSVRLRAVLCPAGHVSHIAIVQKLPHGLTEMAILAARGIKFKPAVKGGAPVAQYITIQYNFDPSDK